MIKHCTLSNDYEKGGLKNIGMFLKKNQPACSVHGLKNYVINLKYWNIIPSILIKNYLHQKFVFQSNLGLKPKIVQKFQKSYHETLRKWGNFLSSFLDILTTLTS